MTIFVNVIDLIGLGILAMVTTFFIVAIAIERHKTKKHRKPSS